MLPVGSSRQDNINSKEASAKPHTELVSRSNNSCADGSLKRHNKTVEFTDSLSSDDGKNCEDVANIKVESAVPRSSPPWLKGLSINSEADFGHDGRSKSCQNFTYGSTAYAPERSAHASLKETRDTTSGCSWHWSARDDFTTRCEKQITVSNEQRQQPGGEQLAEGETRQERDQERHDNDGEIVPAVNEEELVAEAIKAFRLFSNSNTSRSRSDDRRNSTTAAREGVDKGNLNRAEQINNKQRRSATAIAGISSTLGAVESAEGEQDQIPGARGGIESERHCAWEENGWLLKVKDIQINVCCVGDACVCALLFVRFVLEWQY